MQMSNIFPADDNSYRKCVSLLRAGDPVVLPTETVYGLAASAIETNAVSKLYAIKGRASDNPMAITVFSEKQAYEFAHIPSLARRLMDKFWPGPLTLVLPIKDSTNLNPEGLGSDQTIAIRYPDILWVSAFRKMGFDDPIFLTSANMSGKKSPKTAMDVQSELGDRVSLIVDAGPCKTGIESTIVSVNKSCAKILRRGAIPPEELAEFSLEVSAK